VQSSPSSGHAEHPPTFARLFGSHGLELHHTSLALGIVQHMRGGRAATSAHSSFHMRRLVMPHPSRFTVAILAVLGTLPLIKACSSGGQSPPTTVDAFDLQRYLGTWYEIASYPIRPQRGCTATTATYTLRDDGRVDVLNRCRNGALNGNLREASAIAMVPDASQPAKLKVQFFWPLRADYWIIGLDEDYQTAVVSNRRRSTLWILHRQPCMPDHELQPLLDNLAHRGFDLRELRATLQDAGDGTSCQASLLGGQ